MAAKPKIFIDGEAGTTGLQIYTRLADRDDLELLSIDPEKRKDSDERAKLLNAADVAILCLPDDAARLAVSLVTNSHVKVLDASSAHRTAAGWVYGFAELMPEQRHKISQAQRVSNPGCYPTGFLAAVYPLVAAGLIPPALPMTLNAISGYSGGGRKLIEQYEDFRKADHNAEPSHPFCLYGLTFGHKHVKEMHQYSGLSHPPIFVPSVGAFEKGMVVQIPLPLWQLEEAPSGLTLHKALSEHYEGEPFVQVFPMESAAYLRDGKFLDAKDANDTNQVQLFVFANDADQEALLVARLDNLGKGASGAAVQNLNIMLGLPENLGL